MDQEEKYAGTGWLLALGQVLSFITVIAVLAAAALLAWGDALVREDREEPAQLYISATVEHDPADGVFGNITVSAAQGLSLEHAYLLINGAACGDFSQGSLTVRVYAGDRLSVDATAYSQRLDFELSAASASVDQELLQANITCRGNVEDIGSIRFK